MKTYGYIAATEERHMYHRQYFGILAYGVEHMLGHVEFVEEAEFGLDDLESRRLCKLLDSLVDGDILIVCDIHRLGKSIIEIIGVLMEVLKKGAAVFAVDGEYDLGSNRLFQGIPCVLSILLEAKKALILAGINGSKNRKPVNGTPRLGRPAGSIGVSRLDGKEEEIKMLLANGISKAEIARRMSVSRPALHDFCASRKLLEIS